MRAPHDGPIRAETAKAVDALPIERPIVEISHGNRKLANASEPASMPAGDFHTPRNWSVAMIPATAPHGTNSAVWSSLRGIPRRLFERIGFPPGQDSLRVA